MATKETSLRSIKPKDVKQNIQPDSSNAVERKIEYVDDRIAEHFKEHGTPNSVELTDIVRTLGSVFSGDYTDEDTQGKSPLPYPKKPRTKKSA